VQHGGISFSSAAPPVAEPGGLEVAQQMAGHETARTSGLYDRRNDSVALDEIGRIPSTFAALVETPLSPPAFHCSRPINTPFLPVAIIAGIAPAHDAVGGAPKVRTPATRARSW
jgi:hypothetical protein